MATLRDPLLFFALWVDGDGTRPKRDSRTIDSACLYKTTRNFGRKGRQHCIAATASTPDSRCNRCASPPHRLAAAASLAGWQHALYAMILGKMSSLLRAQLYHTCTPNFKWSRLKHTQEEQNQFQKNKKDCGPALSISISCSCTVSAARSCSAVWLTSACSAVKRAQFAARTLCTEAGRRLWLWLFDWLTGLTAACKLGILRNARISPLSCRHLSCLSALELGEQCIGPRLFRFHVCPQRMVLPWLIDRLLCRGRLAAQRRLPDASAVQRITPNQRPRNSAKIIRNSPIFLTNDCRNTAHKTQTQVRCCCPHDQLRLSKGSGD